MQLFTRLLPEECRCVPLRRREAGMWAALKLYQLSTWAFSICILEPQPGARDGTGSRHFSGGDRRLLRNRKQRALKIGVRFGSTSVSNLDKVMQIRSETPHATP